MAAMKNYTLWKPVAYEENSSEATVIFTNVE